MTTRSALLLSVVLACVPATAHGQRRTTPASPTPLAETRGPTLDGSSNEAFAASAQAISSTLPRGDRARFEAALELFRAMAPSPRELQQRLHGMTAADLLRAHAGMLKECDRNGDGRIDEAERALMHRSLSAARTGANEAAAIATLLALSSSQAQVQDMCEIDVNGNGVGEYAFLAELTGAARLRDRTGKPGRRAVAPPIMPPSLRVSAGRCERSGYVFQVYLPDATGTGVAEGARGGVGAQAPDATQAERGWCCYAWPSEHGKTGTRTFFISQTGQVLATEQRYSGASEAPSPNAALREGQQSMLTVREGVVRGNDGSSWRPVDNR